MRNPVFTAASLVGLIAAVFPAFMNAQEVERPTAVVHIVPFWAHGGSAGSSFITLVSLSEPAARFSVLSREAEFSVPYGEYRVTVKNGVEVERLVTVGLPEVWVRVGIPLLRLEQSGGWSGYSLSGKVVIPGGDFSGLWVRVDGLYMPQVSEGPVDSKGLFEIGGLDFGKYIVHLFRGDELLRAIVVEMPTTKGHSTVVLDVSPRR